MTETLTRWNIEPVDGDLCARIAERPDGPFVRYEDAAAALTAAHAERDAALRAKRVTFCHFCLVKINLNGMTPPQALDALKEHSLTCAESPIVAQLTAALRERDALAAELAKL